MPIKSGPENLSALPHRFAAVTSHGFTVDVEKMLKHSRRRNGCMGTWRKDMACDRHSQAIVPWMSAWQVRRKDCRRNACRDRVARVKGRKMRICKAVPSLRKSHRMY
jgi:hypothetical protein